MSQWNKISDKQKDSLPPEFKNVAFRHLVNNLLKSGSNVIERLEFERKETCAILVDLRAVLNAPGAHGVDGVDLDKIRLNQENGDEMGSLQTLMISTTRKSEICSLFESGLVGACLLAVQDTPGCRGALEQAMNALAVPYEKINGEFFFDDAAPRAQFKLYLTLTV